MNPLQQEIYDFHNDVKLVLIQILNDYENTQSQKLYENIQRPAKILLQKCSYKSYSDMTRLCTLAYWLYIYDHHEFAFALCELAHKVRFDYEHRENGIQNIYGLEIRIAREFLKEDRRNQIPQDALLFFSSKREKKKSHYPQILQERELADCDDQSLDLMIFNVLCNLIGKGETGCYPELHAHWDHIDQTIKEYIAYLKA